MSADPSATSARPVRRERRWLPVLAVVAVIAFVDGGAKLAGAAQDEAAGPTRVVGDAVRIRPLSGWAASQPPGAPLPELVLTRGAVTLDVVEVPGATSADELAARYVQEVLRPRFEGLTLGQQDAGTLASGLPALRFGYIGIADGVSIEGVATVAVVTTTGAVFDAFAPKGDLAWAASDLDTMIDGAEVG
jgi:hypothetical protein